MTSMIYSEINFTRNSISLHKQINRVYNHVLQQSTCQPKNKTGSA